MTTLSIDQLLHYNQQGLIPGPQETEQAFSKRASYCLDLKNQIPEMLGHEIPFDPEISYLSEEILSGGCKKTRRLYDICPQWVPLFFSNYKLSFWHGGCAWIFQQRQNTPTSAFFQLRQNFRSSKHYLGIYNRNELVSHELSHVGRMMFEEPKFEEILAYRSSRSSFRRFFGPIVQSSVESMIFMLTLLIVITLDLFVLINGYEEFFHLPMITRLIPLGLFGYAFIRLCIRQYQFKKALINLKKIFLNTHAANAVLYRLTDHEVVLFSKMNAEDISKYISEQKNQTLRWKMIDEAYFKKSNLSNHFNGVHFYNHLPTDRTLKDILKWMWHRKTTIWPQHIPIEPISKNSLLSQTNDISITLVNHSTLLIQWKGVNILTDPIWSERCSPLQWIGPKRVHQPGIRFEDLPPIHLVLVSHNHYDHMDLSTLKKLEEYHQPQFITGLGNADYLSNQGLDDIVELDWWENTSFHHFHISFTPAKHFSMRHPLNKNKTLWGGFILKNDKDYIYFAGDTGYMQDFIEIKKRYGSPKLSLLPIGAYEPRWFMQPIHMSPSDAVQAHLDLDSKQSIAIHFGTFKLSDEEFDDPPKKLKEALAENSLTENKFIILKPGEQICIN